MAIDFLRNFGFSEDPFASTNAADEPRIGSYFVAPPFFPAVVGNPEAPKSNVVFAPRGGGKTAQKIMIEHQSATDGRFLCITYDRFPTEQISNPRQADSEYHLRNISRILLMAVLAQEDMHQNVAFRLSKVDKAIVVRLSRELLGDISSQQFRDALSSVKSLGDRAYEVWAKYGGAITALVNAISARFQIGAVNHGDTVLRPEDGTMRFKFEYLASLIQTIGYKSVYVLVDRVDELPMTTQNAEKGLDFLSSILIDLPLLETRGVAFKFFLWDQMKDAYHAAGGRPDRLLEYDLEWSVDELDRVLTRRIEIYSGGSISSFNSMLSGDAPYDVHKLITYFAHNSPRDMIRICKKILDEHTRSGKFAPKIEFKTVRSALQAFSVERSRELYGQHFTELRKIGELDFTISFLASESLRVSQQAARSKVQKWQTSGAVVKIGEVPNPGNRPQYLFGIVDPRLAISILGNTTIEEAVEHILITCPHCRNLRISWSGESITCPDCQATFAPADAKFLSEECAIQP